MENAAIHALRGSVKWLNRTYVDQRIKDHRKWYVIPRSGAICKIQRLPDESWSDQLEGFEKSKLNSGSLD